jgi:hypothetical protein
MSAGFVSGGTAYNPDQKSEQWENTEKELQKNRQRKAEQARQADGRSLYETLEANKGTTRAIFLSLYMPLELRLITQGCFE